MRGSRQLTDGRALAWILRGAPRLAFEHRTLLDRQCVVKDIALDLARRLKHDALSAYRAVHASADHDLFGDDTAGDIKAFRILCLTFTRKAAAEMGTRLLNLAPCAKDRVLLTTFHSFATDILRQNGSHFGLSPDFEIVEESERVGLVKLVLSQNEEELTRFVSAEKALTAIDFLFRNIIPDERVPSLLKDPEVGGQLQTLFIGYKQLLRQQNCLDYGAILYFCEELLRERPRLSKQLRTVYRYICVDEFQDTNVAQYQLLRSLTPDRNSNLFIVGDDDQVIYQWNGASPERVRQLEQHYALDDHPAA